MQVMRTGSSSAAEWLGAPAEKADAASAEESGTHREVEPAQHPQVVLCSECNSEVAVRIPVCEVRGNMFNISIKAETPEESQRLEREFMNHRQQQIQKSKEARVMMLLANLGLSEMTSDVRTKQTSSTMRRRSARGKSGLCIREASFF